MTVCLLSRTLSFKITWISFSPFHTSTSSPRWYKSLLRSKNVTSRTPRILPSFDDCEQKPYQDVDPEIVQPLAAQTALIDSLDDSVKRVFTYRFASKQEQLLDNINDKLVELGYHPTDTSPGARVIRMTVQLRYKKSMLQKHPKNTQLLFATKALISARIYTLRLLRATDMAEFNRLTKALEITDLRHPDPFQMPDANPAASRKRAVREECYQSRLTRLANYKVQLALSSDEFYNRKESLLTKLIQDLESVVPCPPDPAERHKEAERWLQALFQEVVAERQAEVLKQPDRDALSWLEWEAVQRERYAENMAKKAQKQLKKKR